KDRNVERIKKTMEDLTRAAHKLAEEIYKQAASKQQQTQGQRTEDREQKTEEPRSGKSAAGGSASGGKDEDIIDAEYKEEDDKK
ncbi:MAG: hypothetical protein HZC16_01745, partial [Candidatus Omnitrophica bacterium]|nr:hypothetical protein [Candidatus Omnitrophota bacterium]